MKPTFHKLNLRLFALIDLIFRGLYLLRKTRFLGIIHLCLLYDGSGRLLRVVRDHVHERTRGTFIFIQSQVYSGVLSREDGSKIDMWSVGRGGHYRRGGG